MSTRSIIVITGEAKYNQSSTVRIYKHSDGYPTGVLPIIGKTIKAAQAQCDDYNARFVTDTSKPLSPIVEQVMGLFLGESTWVYGMAARIDDDDLKDAIYPAAFNPIFLGSQWDLEWIYVVNLSDKTVKIYGGGYADCSPQDHFAKGCVDPASYAEALYPQYRKRELAETEEAVREIESLGYKVNPATGDNDPKPKKKDSKKTKKELAFNGAKQNAVVEIVRDPVKGKLRASHEGGWVRFPNHLRISGAIYRVEVLKQGASGSWIACGRIERMVA